MTVKCGDGSTEMPETVRAWYQFFRTSIIIGGKIRHRDDRVNSLRRSNAFRHNSKKCPMLRANPFKMDAVDNIQIARNTHFQVRLKLYIY